MSAAGTKLSGGHSSSVLCVDVNTQTGEVISGGEDGELCLWSANGQLVKKITRPDSDCTSVIFSKENNTKLVYAAFGTQILTFDLANFQDPIFTLQSNTEEINQILLDPKEHFLAACDDAGEIKIYGLQDKKVFKTLRFKHTNLCSSVAFRTNRQWEIVSAGLDCRVVHWDFSKPKCLNQFNMQELHATPGESAYMINPPFVHHISTSPDSATFACALENGQIPIFNSRQKNLQSQYALFGHTQGVSQVHFIDNSKLLSAGNDYKIVLWDLSKSDLYEPHDVYMNGNSGGGDGGGAAASNPLEEKFLAITELCRVRSISHPYKVNWMVPFGPEDDKKVYLADQSSDISVVSLQ